MKQGEDLWKKYCSFFELDFSKQLEYSEKKLKEHFERWKNTKIAKLLCPKGVEKFEDIPLTAYADYPILHEFGEQVEHYRKTIPRRKGELLWDYYMRIGKQVAPMLDGWLPDEYSFCACTGGTTGKSKWIPHGAISRKTLFADGMLIVILACSEKFGETSIRSGDNILNMIAPIPFITGYAWKFLEKEFNIIPPFEVTDNIGDIRKKVGITLKMLKKKKVCWVGGTASFLKLLHTYLVNPEELYREYYLSTEPGIKKFILYLLWLKSKLSGKKYENIKEILPLKGIMIGGVGTGPYIEFIKSAYGLEPMIAYGSTELACMYGIPPRKIDLHPLIDLRYYEFLDKNGEIKKIDELKKGEVYELLCTIFGSILIRYSVDDLLRVVDIRDDGMPLFNFESRKTGVLDIYGWFRLTDAIAEKAMYRAGLRMSDNWVFVKELDPKEHLLLLMEKDWEYSEEKASKRLFESLKELDHNFRNYIEDFKIKNPLEIIKVKYLKKGAFQRYGLKMEREGRPFTHYKPPKMITPEKHNIAETLIEM